VRLEALGVIGNCQFSALVDNKGELVWCCLPRFDSEPVFSTLLDHEQGGRFRISPAGGETGSQRYLPNTKRLGASLQPERWVRHTHCRLCHLHVLVD
jgi:GH15 family glucan-1,4-alpha-glucosidase